MKEETSLIRTTGLIVTFSVVGFIGTALADDDAQYRNNYYGHEEQGSYYDKRSAQDEIEDLMSCYAYGSDAIGRAVNATIQVPPPFDGTDANIHEDPNFAEGLRLYRKCFAEDWILAVEINGVPFELPPGFLAPGPLAWANFVNNGARTGGQRDTQHVFGSISSTVHGWNKGTLKAYAIIHTMFLPGFPNSGNVNVGTSTYTSDVVRRHGRWLLQKTTINITSGTSTPES